MHEVRKRARVGWIGSVEFLVEGVGFEPCDGDKQRAA